MQFQLWHACWKQRSSHASSFLRKWTSSFFFLSNLPLPVSEHFNLLYLHHTAFATLFFFFVKYRAMLKASHPAHIPSVLHYTFLQHEA